VAPFALGFGAAGTVAAVAGGVLLVGLALAGSESLPLGAHRAFDQMVVAVLAGCGLVLALAGDPLAGIALLVLVSVQLTLTTFTRWTRG
jgi:hypothetical protein